MSITLTLVLVITFSFIASRFLHRLTTNRQLLLSGVEYLIIGLLLGPVASGVLNTTALELLHPAIALLLGLVGFVMGLPLRHHLRAAAMRDVLIGAGIALLSLASISAVTLALMRHLMPDQLWLDLLPGALVVGAAGAVVSGRLLEAGAASLQAHGPVLRLLMTAALTGNTLAVVIAGLALDFKHSLKFPATIRYFDLPAEVWLITSVGVGLVSGVLFVLFHRNDESEERIFLATVGVVIFASGIAQALGSSPLLVNLVAGLTVSVLSPQADALSHQLDRLEQPAFVALLLFAGAMWAPLHGVEWLLPIGYLLCRALSLLLWPTLVTTALRHRASAHRVGAGLRAQGGLAVAIALSLELADIGLGVLYATIIIGALFFELGAGGGLRRMLADAGELSAMPSAGEVSA